MPEEANKKEHLEINKKLDIHFDKLNEILKILNGNGKIGVCAKVNIMWSSILFIVMAVIGTMIKVFING